MVRLAVAVLVLGLTAAANASAMSFTLDSYAQTVERPSSGFVDVEFTGTVTVDDGFQLLFATISPLMTAAGEMIDSVWPHLPVGGVAANTPATLFLVRVADTDLPGHYAFSGAAPAFITFSQCQIGGGSCNGVTVNYSLDVVKSVPEPASLGLLGTTLAGLTLWGRKRY
jgi:hypothetical protein